MAKDERYISVEQSIIQACHEVNLMRAGLKPKRYWRDAMAELEKEVALIEEEDNSEEFNRKATKKHDYKSSHKFQCLWLM